MTKEDANKQLYLHKPEQVEEEHMKTWVRGGPKTALNWEVNNVRISKYSLPSTTYKSQYVCKQIFTTQQNTDSQLVR
jgi:hypothetical protein